MSLTTVAGNILDQDQLSGRLPRVVQRNSCGGALICAVFLSVGCGPRITNIAPSVATPGDKVLIQGSRLTAGTDNPESVDFNGTPATVYTVAGPDIEATVPANASTGRVHVKTSYVDFLSPGGTATSPFDFTVTTTAYNEQEPNDAQSNPNVAGLASRIVGALDSNDADWFKLTTGPSGPWGYAMEFQAEIQGLPDGVELRAELLGYRADLDDIGILTYAYSDGNSASWWATYEPNTDMHLKIDWVGFTSENFTAKYAINVSRIEIPDTNEPDNNYNTPYVHNDDVSLAKEINLDGGFGGHNGSYLCDVIKAGKDVGMLDFYKFKPAGATKISVLLITSPLYPPPGPDTSGAGLHLRVLDQDLNSRGEVHGDNTAAQLHIELNPPEQADGTWYVRVSNSWDHQSTADPGSAPLSCKNPYAVMIVAN